MSSTTRSIVLLGEAAQGLLAVACLDDAVAVALERVGEQPLDRVLVVDEQDGRGIPASSRWLDAGKTPARSYYSPRRGGPRLTPAAASATATRLPAGARRCRQAAGRRGRTRRGSLDPPINGALVRGMALLVLARYSCSC